MTTRIVNIPEGVAWNRPATTTSWQLTIFGAPRTKKNHGSVIQRGERLIHIPSAAYQVWEASATIRRPTLPEGERWPIPAVPLNLCAIIYRDALTGDLAGYVQGLCDFLQTRRIIANDKWIVALDGTRLGKDSKKPRVELILSRMDEIALALLNHG